MISSDRTDKALHSDAESNIRPHIGTAFKVKATGDNGHCIDVDHATNPPRLLLRFSHEKTRWHCHSSLHELS